MKKSLIYSIMSIIVILEITSCTDDTTDQELGSNGTFLLSSDKGTFTRAASTEQTFSKGTAYQLYAINADNNDFEHNYLKNPASSGPVTGKESDSHEYIDDITFNKFNGRTLNFYAVTNSTSEEVEIIPNGKSAPTCHIEYKNNMTPLTDVMWAKKENQSYKNSGVIKLLFGHTLSKLNLYVMKNSEYKETSVILNSISLTDYGSGSLNMQTGKYDLSNTDKRDYSCTVYTGGTQIVTTEAETVKNEKVAVTPTIFPIRKENENLTTSDIDNHSTKITVTATIGGKRTDNTIRITSTMPESAGSATNKEVPFAFEGNHEYDMVITITKSSLVVTIVPRLYDWIPEEELKEDDEVNSSMTVGGITWMDRNLGATSGDPLASEQAWENSRGYYYQYGRNIPYYIIQKTRDGIKYAPTNGNLFKKESRPFPFIPGNLDKEPTKENGNLARKVGDTNKDFNYFYGAENWISDNATYWDEVKDQPCPKGWRLPTVDEFRLIIPATAQAGDISFRLHENNNIYREEASDDPENGSKSIYIGVKRSWDASFVVGVSNAVYALKRSHTDKAYYLRWHIEQCGDKEVYEDPNNKNVEDYDRGSAYRNVLVISRYPATSKSLLTEDNVTTAAKWNYPVEQIRLPISGYILSGDRGSDYEGGGTHPALIYSGTEAVYWTSSTNGNRSYTVRMKFAGGKASSQIMIYEKEVRTNGCLIRCVRDTKAE